MSKYVFVAVAILLLGENVFAQKVIHGKVSDATAHNSLPFVNVFINNTTLGTVSGNDGEYMLVVPQNQGEIIFSFVGYQSGKMKFSIPATDSLRIDMNLFPSAQELESVTVQTSPDKEWNKHIKQFQKIFLGNNDAAAQSTIRNPWCIDLKREKNFGKQVLMAHSSQPIEIDNFALGYKVFYDLQHFSASNKNDKFSGNVYFVELKPKDSLQGEQWERNRQNSYLVSTRHLLESILRRRLKEDGFTLFAYLTKDNSTRLVAYNPSSIRFDSLKGKYEIPKGQKIEVRYSGSGASNGEMFATIEFSNNVYVDHHGLIEDPLSVITSGYLSKSRVANLLPDNYLLTTRPDLRIDNPFVPYDSKPSRIVESMSMEALARLDSLEQKANYYSENHPIEKVYVHFDKPFYVSGENSWYKAYVVRGSDLNPTDISTVLYLDWINPSGKVISHQRLKIDNGGTVGDLTIDPALDEGIYSVRAYTSWMRNQDPELFFSKSVPVFNTKKMQSAKQADSINSKIDIQFLPEGGTLIEGVLTKIAFKAIDVNGRGIEVKGHIADEKNNLVSIFQSVHNGMGVFPLISNPHKSYKAVLENGQIYPLPLPSRGGLALSASSLNESRIQVRIQASNEYEASGIYLIGHSRGSVYYKEYIDLESTSVNISIPKDDLPEGVLQLTVLNREGVPQCERMLFIKKSERMVVNVESDREQYSPKDSIVLDFKVNDVDGNPSETSLSVSVTDADFVAADKNSENIFTRLLLQSDLKGKVESPGWYFESQAPDRAYALDLVMLTHGWSRYNWKKILESGNDTIDFMPEKGITLKGLILDKDRPVVTAPFTLTAQQGGNEFFNIYESDSLGHFRIPDLDFSDTITFSWLVMSGRKGKVQHSEIRLDTIQDIPPVIEHGIQYRLSGRSGNELYENLVARFLKTGVWNQDNTRMLDEVVVIGEKIRIKTVGANAIILKPDDLDIKSRVSTAQLVNRYALASKIGSISINGYVEEGDPYTILNGIPIEQVEYIIVGGNIHDGYGIVIGTKKAITQMDVGVVRKKIKGYDTAREFYHPKYGPLDISTSRPDNRMTLYWNANLQTNKDGIANIKFYNTDTTQKLLIVVEGIASGIPFSTVQIVGKDE